MKRRIKSSAHTAKPFLRVGQAGEGQIWRGGFVPEVLFLSTTLSIRVRQLDAV